MQNVVVVVVVVATLMPPAPKSAHKVSQRRGSQVSPCIPTPFAARAMSPMQRIEKTDSAHRRGRSGASTYMFTDRLLSICTITTIGLFCKAALNLGFCSSVTVSGLHHLLDALADEETRKSGRGVVTGTSVSYFLCLLELTCK